MTCIWVVLLTYNGARTSFRFLHWQPPKYCLWVGVLKIKDEICWAIIYWIKCEMELHSISSAYNYWQCGNIARRIMHSEFVHGDFGRRCNFAVFRSKRVNPADGLTQNFLSIASYLSAHFIYTPLNANLKWESSRCFEHTTVLPQPWKGEAIFGKATQFISFQKQRIYEFLPMHCLPNFLLLYKLFEYECLLAGSEFFITSSEAVYILL
jgi:hypothetical protein